jgi:hypothetical protein
VNIILTFIGVFFAASGAYAIIESLSKLGNDKSDSSIETGWFKMKAPAGFVYGIIAFGIVVALIKYHGYEDQTNKIKKLENKLSEIQNVGLTKPENLNLMNLKIKGHKPVSIFDGKILLDYKSRDLEFSGIKGISKNKNGKFSNKEIEISKGMKFYLMTKDSIILGINVLESTYDAELEIYRE